MGLTEVLTIIMVILKLIGRLDWARWIIFVPELIAIVAYALVLISYIKTQRLLGRRITRSFDFDTEDFYI